MPKYNGWAIVPQGRERNSTGRRNGQKSKKMKLTGEDYKTIASHIVEGTGSIEYDKGGEVMIITYDLETEGVYEDETDGFYVTSRHLFADAEVYDEDGLVGDYELDNQKLLNFL